MNIIIQRLIDMNEQLCNLVVEKDKTIERKQFKINELALSVRRLEFLIEQKDIELVELKKQLSVYDGAYIFTDGSIQWSDED